MKKFTKILAIVMVLALVIAGTVAVTVAYLTAQTEDKFNEFAVGDISIDLDETVDADGAATVVDTNEGASFTNVMPGDVLTKEVFVTNTSTNPAYVAVTLTVNNVDKIKAAIDERYAADQIQGIYDRVFNDWGLTYNASGISLTSGLPTDETLLRVDAAMTNGAYEAAADNWFQDANYYANGNTKLSIAPMGQDEMRFTYYLYLEGGETFTLFEGLNAPVEFDRKQLQMFKDLQIRAEAAAIQADNTVSAQNAFAVLAGDVEANIFAPATGDELAELFANIPNGATVTLDPQVDYGTVEITGKLGNVTVDGNGASLFMDVVAGAELNNVTFQNFAFDYAITEGSYAGVVDFKAGCTAENVTFQNCTFTGTGGRSAAIGAYEPSANITLIDCVVDGPKYVVYGSSPIDELTIQDCDIQNISSWAVLLNGGDQVTANLTIDGCTFTNCPDGIAKYLGGSQPEGATTVFTNNTLTNCKGHDGSDAKWFTIPGAADTITVSGNTLDGAAFTPGTANGLGK